MGDGVRHLKEHLAFPFIHKALKDFDLTSGDPSSPGAALDECEILSKINIFWGNRIFSGYLAGIRSISKASINHLPSTFLRLKVSFVKTCGASVAPKYHVLVRT